MLYKKLKIKIQMWYFYTMSIKKVLKTDIVKLLCAYGGIQWL